MYFKLHSVECGKQLQVPNLTHVRQVSSKLVLVLTLPNRIHYEELPPCKLDQGREVVVQHLHFDMQFFQHPNNVEE